MSKHISIEKEATIAKKFPINAMHDITEGGIFGAVAEMAEASKVGAVIDVNSIEINPITQKICSVLGVDVYRLISSGSLIISAPNPAPLINELRKMESKQALWENSQKTNILSLTLEIGKKILKPRAMSCLRQ